MAFLGERLALAEPEELTPLGFSRRKAEYVVALARSDLDLDEHVARPRLRVRHVLEAEITRSVEAKSPHGVNTSFSARPER